MSTGFDAEKLAKMQAMAGARVGAKGTPRRKVIPRAPPAGDDKKIQAALKKLAVQPIAGIEEINMFQSNGKVLHFNAPKVHGAASSNTYAIYGQAQEKAITDILSTSMAQLGEKEVNYLQSTLGGGEAETGAEDDLPELVEQLELKESGLEEIN